MYNPADIHWDVLNDIMSLYYLYIYRIFGLKGPQLNLMRLVHAVHSNGPLPQVIPSSNLKRFNLIINILEWESSHDHIIVQFK